MKALSGFTRVRQNVMKIPLAIPNLEGREAEFLQKCIETTFVSSVGPFVDQFESQIAELSGTSKAAVLSSGTSALHMAYSALGIGPGDLVMMPSLTFIATSNAISHSGAAPWLVDVDKDSWALDLDLCRRLIEEETTPDEGGRRHKRSGMRLRAICPVMIMGASLDFAAISKLAAEYDLRVVVDAAAAIGGRGVDGDKLGSSGVDAVCYSFNGNKTVTCGGGGAVASAHDDVIARVKHLSTTGRVGRDYDHDIVAYNLRMTNVQAALGVAQLERLPQFLAAKASHAAAYSALARSYPCLQPFPDPSGQSTHWFSGFYYIGDNLELCDAFRTHMNEAGVDLRKFWKPIHLQAPYKDAAQSDMPICDRLWERIFPLPCSTHLSQEDLDKTLGAAKAFWDAHGH